MSPDWLKTTMAPIVRSLQLAKTEVLTPYTYTFGSLSENFSAYSILRAALFSATSPAKRLRLTGSLAKIAMLVLQSTVREKVVTGTFTYNTLSTKILKKRIKTQRKIVNP